MTQGKPTPQYKFRLLCRRCNSYMHTSLTRAGTKLFLRCSRCEITASGLDEIVEPTPLDGALEHS
jgi:hypothetical protein